MTKSEKETVDHPLHYGGDTVYETIKVIEAWDLNFSLGCVVKYVSRAGKKGDALEDLEKARWYLDREIQRSEGGEPSASASDPKQIGETLNQLPAEAQDAVTEYLLCCGNKWGTTETSFRGSWQAPGRGRRVVDAPLFDAILDMHARHSVAPESPRDTLARILAEYESGKVGEGAPGALDRFNSGRRRDALRNPELTEQEAGEVNGLVSRLVNLTPAQQDEVTEALLAAKVPWGTRKGRGP